MQKVIVESRVEGLVSFNKVKYVSFTKEISGTKFLELFRKNVYPVFVEHEPPLCEVGHNAIYLSVVVVRSLTTSIRMSS